MVTSVQELLARLMAQPSVAGIVRYGGHPVDAVGAGGDLDLCLLADERPPALESVHFHIGMLPVDLNVRIWADLEREPPLTPIDHAIAVGEVLYDRDGDLAPRLRALAARHAPPPSLSEHDVAFVRFGQRHSLDKVRGRLGSDPVLCRVLLESNVYWLIQHYFLVRQRVFPGEKRALAHLERHEPALWRDLQRFYAVSDLPERLALAEALNERILAPVGGLWRPGEVLALGADVPAADLQAVGHGFLEALLRPGDIEGG
jgi:hypothetical protein